MNITPAKRAIAAFALFIMLAVPAMAYASSYWSSLNFSWQVQGATRYYDGSNMNISLTTNATAPGGSYNITLYRDGIFDTNLGTRSASRVGSYSTRWSGVGSGYYYFFFSKAQDGVTVWSNNVHMYN